MAADSYGALRAGFGWDVPDVMNMGVSVCDVWEAMAPDRPAIVDVTEGRHVTTYGQLRGMADRLAYALLQSGVARGHRVGVLRGQGAWCAAAHIAIWKIGAISVPLFKLFRAEALASRVSDAGARIIVTDPEGVAAVKALEGVAALMPEAGLPQLAEPVRALPCAPDDPAVLIYTSGTTGRAKGALHGHRILEGHLPGVQMSHDHLGQPGDVLWTPADWAWIGGLFDVLMPGLRLGVPVVALRAQKFSSKIFGRAVAEGGARNVFLPPTALRMLKAEGACLSGLRSVASGGEPLGAEMLAWGRAALNVQINEFYGQTECNMVASSSGALFDPKPGFLGKAVPGFDVAVLDESGARTSGEGDIAVRRGCASMMLRYWNNPEATQEKFRGDWLITGDRGLIEDGFIRFVGREDDVITSAGYRIGPAEIEDCLLTHPAVATVGVVGKPDSLRTQIVKAYVVRKPNLHVTEKALQDWVRTRLAAHCYPREVTFLDALPMTVTGKVIRKDLRARAVQETEP